MAFAFGYGAAGSAFADPQHVVDPSQLAASVAQKVAIQDADRAAIRDALARPRFVRWRPPWALT